MPSPTQNAFMDRMRQMMFRPIRNRAPEPARPDYNEHPSAGETAQIPVEDDYNPFLFQNVNANDIQPSVFRHTAEREQAIRDSAWERFQQSRSAQQAQSHDGWYGHLRHGQTPESVARRSQSADHSDAWRYAQQAPQPSERTLTRERLRYAAERLRSGVVSTPWHEAPEWFSHRRNELVELPYVMEYGSVCECLLRWEGDEYIVLPTISLKTGQVEYKKGSPEPQNGKERTECEEFAMKEIRKWAAENKTLAAMA